MARAGFTKGLLALAFAALLAATGSAPAFAQAKAGPMTPPPPAKTPPQPQQPSGQQTPQQKPPQYSLELQTQVVNVDVVVTDDDGNPIPGLKADNFRVLADKTPQTISNFAPTDAPITMVMLMEYSNLYYGWFAYTSQYWTYDFLSQLKPQDWIALVTYDLRPHIVQDFTQNKSELGDALRSLGFPGFSEADLYDSVLFTLERLQNVKGKKAVLLVASGLNTFSSHNLDDILKVLKESEVTFFCVGVDQPLYLYADSHGMLGSIQRLNFLQAENQLGAFASLTGGRAWFPRFDGELPGIFHQVAQSLRYQYSLAFTPTLPNDGKFHKISVDLVAPDGKPLIILDQRNKKVKYHIYARQQYKAPPAQTASAGGSS